MLLEHLNLQATAKLSHHRIFFSIEKRFSCISSITLKDQIKGGREKIFFDFSHNMRHIWVILHSNILYREIHQTDQLLTFCSRSFFYWRPLTPLGGAVCKLLSLTLSRDVVYSMTQLPASAHVLARTRGGARWCRTWGLQYGVADN